MSQLRSPLPALALLALFLAPNLASQTTVQIPCDRDNTLFDNGHTFSNGAGSFIFAGVDAIGFKRRCLVRFDVAAAVPAGARIVEASMFVYCSRWNGAFDLPVFLHRALADWGEGASNAPGQEGAGTAAAANDATWLHRFYPNTPWTNPGGDFAPSPSGLSVVHFMGNTFEGARMAGDAQAWLDDPTTNFGWLLKTDEQFPRDVRRFDSRENALVPNRPVLTVTYLMPGQSTTFGAGCPGSATAALSLQVQGMPIGGTTLSLDVSNGMPAAAVANVLGLAFDAPGVALYPGCLLHVDPVLPFATLNVTTLSSTGTTSTPVTIPPGFPDVFLVAQAVALDSGLSTGFVLSNAWIGLTQ